MYCDRRSKRQHYYLDHWSVLRHQNSSYRFDSRQTRRLCSCRAQLDLSQFLPAPILYQGLNYEWQMRIYRRSSGMLVIESRLSRCRLFYKLQHHHILHISLNSKKAQEKRKGLLPCSSHSLIQTSWFQHSLFCENQGHQ